MMPPSRSPLSPGGVALGVLLLAACSSGKTRIDQSGAPAPGTVLITTEPAGAAVFLGAEKRLGRTPLTLERPGGTSLDLRLVKDGHRTHRQSALILSGQQLRLHAALQRQEATLLVQAAGLRGGEILLDGRPIGRTPDRVTVEVGATYEVEVRKKGFHPYRERVRVEMEGTIEVDAFLVPQGQRVPPSGWLQVQSDGPVILSLDNRVLGMTPLRRLRLRAKPYSLKVQEPASKRTIRTLRVVVRPNEETLINVSPK